MSRWKKHDFYCDAFKEALPMVLARAWLETNLQRVEQALPQLLPEDVLQWTEGSLELVQVAQFFLHKIMPEAVAEAIAPMQSDLGRKIASIRPPKWRQDRSLWDAPAQPQPVWHEAMYMELQDMIAEHLQKSSAWWKANATSFRQHANKLRTVKKIQEA